MESLNFRLPTTTGPSGAEPKPSQTVPGPPPRAAGQKKEVTLPPLPGGGRTARRAAPSAPQPDDLDVPEEAVDGYSELEDEAGEDRSFDLVRPKAVREAGQDGRTRLPTQKEKDYVDFILKAGGASTHTISRLHGQARQSTYRKLKWLKDNGFIHMEEFTYGPPLWTAAGKREVYFSANRHLYDVAALSLQKLEHDLIVAYLTAEWIGGLVDNLGLFLDSQPPAALLKVAENRGVVAGGKPTVSKSDYAAADAVRRQRLGSTALTREIDHSIKSKREQIRRAYRDRSVEMTSDDLVRTFIDLKDRALSVTDSDLFDRSLRTGHAYLHPVGHDAWMAGVPVLSYESYAGRAKIFEPDAVLFDERVGRVALEVERSPKNRADWWEKLWGYYKHNQHISNLTVGGSTGGTYYDFIVYVFTDKATRDNFRGMLREAKEAPADASNTREKELVAWLADTGCLLLRDLMVPEENWKSPTTLVSHIAQGGAMTL